jgi:hypothetical protein
MQDLVTTDNEDNKEKSLTVSTDQIASSNEFIENVIEIVNEIKEIESFYSESKKHLMKEMEIDDPSVPKRLGTPVQRKSTTFITMQTANLVAMKNLKLALLKEKTRIKENKLDRDIKLATMITKKEESNDTDKNNSEILNYILNNMKVVVPITLDHQPFSTIAEDAEIIDDEELERRIDEEIDELVPENFIDTQGTPSSETEASTKPEEFNIDGDKRRLVIDLETMKVLLVNDNYDLIKEMADDECQIDFLDNDEEILYDAISKTLVETL